MREYCWLTLAQLRLIVRRIGRGDRALAASLVVRLSIVAGFTILTAKGAAAALSALAAISSEWPELTVALELNLLASWALLIVVMVLVNAMHSSYVTMYEAEETGFLLALPLSGATVLANRLTASLAGYAVFAMPALGPFLAYGTAHGASWQYYVLTFAIIAAFLVLLVSGAALFITLVMAYVPGVSVKRWLMSLGLLVGISIVFATQYAATNLDGSGDLLALLERLGRLSGSGAALMPHVWLARAAQAAVSGGGPGWALLLISTAGLTTALVVTLAGGAYVRSWAGGQETQRRSRRARSVASKARQGVMQRQGAAAWSATPFWAIARMDLLKALRTPVAWYLVATGLVIVGFQVVSVARALGGAAPVDPGQADRWRLLLLGFAIGGPAMAGSALASSAFSSEGRNFGLMRSWPVASRTLFMAKVLAPMPMPFVAAAVALTVLSRVVDIPWPPLGVYLPVIALCLLPMLSVMALVDLTFPDFATGSQGGTSSHASGTAVIRRLLALYGGVGIVAVMVLTLGFGTYHHQMGWVWAAALSPSQAGLAGAVAFVAEATLFTALAVHLGTRRLDRLSRHNPQGT